MVIQKSGDFDMIDNKISKKERRERLKNYLADNLFATDEQLAEHFGVSVPTIRLDRMVLEIPEVRERLKTVARQAFTSLRSIEEGEIVGKLLTLDVEKQGVSELVITSRMVLGKTKYARGHYLFAQANSLAVAIIDADLVLTGSSRLRYKRPVFENEVITAKATVKEKKGNIYLVSVYSYVGEEIVFKAQIVLLAK